MLIIALLILRLIFPEVAVAVQGKLFVMGFDDNPEWNCIANDKGITLYERWVKFNDSIKVRERKAEMVVDCRYDKVVSYLSTYRSMSDWMSNVKSIDCISKPNDALCLLNVEFQLPWPFDNREVVGCYQAFKLDKEHCKIKLTSVPSQKAPKKGRVRINKFEASLDLRMINEHRTKIELVTFSNEMPILPIKIQEPILRKLYHANMQKLRDKLVASND